MLSSAKLTKFNWFSTPLFPLQQTIVICSYVSRQNLVGSEAGFSVDQIKLRNIVPVLIVERNFHSGKRHLHATATHEIGPQGLKYDETVLQ